MSKKKPDHTTPSWARIEPTVLALESFGITTITRPCPAPANGWNSDSKNHTTKIAAARASSAATRARVSLNRPPPWPLPTWSPPPRPPARLTDGRPARSRSRRCSSSASRRAGGGIGGGVEIGGGGGSADSSTGIGEEEEEGGRRRRRRRSRSRRSDLSRGRLRRLCRLLRHDGGQNGLGGLLGFESGAAACALFPISLAFLLGAFAGGL